MSLTFVVGRNFASDSALLNQDTITFWLRRKTVMLYWAAVFFIIAIVAGLFGFGAIASASAGIAQILFFIFAVLFVLALAMQLLPRRG